MPLTMDILDVKIYGIWLAMTSVINWTSLLDFGLSNGLKNKLAGALALNDIVLSKKYISTSYFIQLLLFFVICLIFFIVSYFIDWGSLLGLHNKENSDFSIAFNILFVLFFLKLIFQIISVISAANQNTYYGKFLVFLTNMLTLLVVFYIKTVNFEIGIVGLTLVYGFIPVIVYLLASFHYFFILHKELIPSVRFIDLTKAKDLLNLGIKFFLIQISAIVLFSSGNFIILRLFDGAMVAIYNIAYKLFSIMNIAFDLITASFWVAYTEAWVKKDFIWIKQTNNKLLLIWMFIGVFGLMALLFSNQIYFIWVKDRVHVPFNLSLLAYIYFLTFTFGGVFNVFINSTGKIQLQWISLLISAVLFLPLIYFFYKVLDLGIYSLLIALILVNYYSIIIAPIQFYKLINGTAKGIFNK
jgi:O-antigen/teichoic acid export membrane protein